MSNNTPAPAEVERFILANLPSTYGHLCSAFQDRDNYSREIDKGLQRLRRRGVIAFQREGKQVIWSKIGGEA